MHIHTLTPSHPDRMWSVALGLAAGMGVVMGSINQQQNFCVVCVCVVSGRIFYMV